MKELLEAGVHFGHQTKRWNPKMKHVSSSANGTASTSSTSGRPRSCSARPRSSSPASPRRAAPSCSWAPSARRRTRSPRRRSAAGMYFVNQRWLGGLLTNFTTIQRSLGRLKELEAMATDGRYESLSKKEIARIEKEKRKLQKNLDGIRLMSASARRGLHRGHPQGEDRRRRGAQARRSPSSAWSTPTATPTRSITSSPGNDDALRAIRLFASRLADAIVTGRGLREAVHAEPRPTRPPRRSAARAVRRPRPDHAPTPASAGLRVTADRDSSPSAGRAHHAGRRFLRTGPRGPTRLERRDDARWQSRLNRSRPSASGPARG